MAERYLSESSVIQALNSEGYTRNMRVHKKVLALPAADVVERRTGKWLHEQLLPDNVYGHMVAECSVCHEVRIVDNYCPNCGSKNEVGQDEQH